MPGTPFLNLWLKPLSPGIPTYALAFPAHPVPRASGLSDPRNLSHRLNDVLRNGNVAIEHVDFL